MNEFYNSANSSTYNATPALNWNNAYSEGMLFSCTLSQDEINVGPTGIFKGGFNYYSYLNFANSLKSDLWLSQFTLQNVGGYLGVGQIPNVIPQIQNYTNSFFNAVLSLSSYP